jgi:hypothetical protein
MADFSAGGEGTTMTDAQFAEVDAAIASLQAAIEAAEAIMTRLLAEKQAPAISSGTRVTAAEIVRTRNAWG